MSMVTQLVSGKLSIKLSLEKAMAIHSSKKQQTKTHIVQE